MPWLGQASIWVRVVFVVACAATAIALVYAEEDLRGYHVWRHFEGQCLAKGEPLDSASMVPLPVPDDQNFALTPIVFTSYGYILTRGGKLIPPTQRETNFAMRMRIPPTADSSSLNDAYGHWMSGTFTKLEAFQNYYRNRAAQTNEYPVPVQRGSPAADVLLALSKYDGVIEELRAANRLPESRFPINYDSESPWDILLPHLAPLKICAQTLQLRSLAELQNGEPQKALEDICLGLQLSDKVRNEPILISHLVRLAMLNLMLQPVWEGLARHQWSDEQLVALEAELDRIDFFPGFRLSMHGELGGQTGEMELIRRHPTKMYDLEGMTDRDGHNTGSDIPGAIVACCIPKGWFYQAEYRCARLVVDYYLLSADSATRTFSPEQVRRGQQALAEDMHSSSLFNWYEKIMLPALNTSTKKFAFGQAAVDLARTAVALERYRLAHGEYPETLEALAPKYLPAPPHDVIGGQPLKYHRGLAGRFVVYSIGWNGTDDDGKVVPNKGAMPPIDLDQGDWVWAYPAE
jgi:hypothetical protein